MLARDMAATPVRNRSTSPPSADSPSGRRSASPCTGRTAVTLQADFPTNIEEANNSDSDPQPGRAAQVQAQATANGMQASSKIKGDENGTTWEGDDLSAAAPEAAVAMPGSKLSLRSNGSAATRPSYDKAMDRPGYMQGIAPRGGALPAPVREDNDQLAYAGTETTDLDAALDPSPPRRSVVQGSILPSLAQVTSLHSVADPDSTGAELGEHDHHPKLQRQRTPPSVSRQDSYACATMAQGLLSPGSLPRLLVAVPETGEDSVVASGRGHPPSAQLPTPTARLSKEDSYATALGNIVSAGSLPSCTGSLGKESAV